MSMRRSVPFPWRATPPQTQPPSGDETLRLSPDADLASYAWAYTFSKFLGDATTGDGTWNDRGFPGAGNVAWVRFSFPTPPYRLTGEQTFRVRAKASTTTGTPKIAVRVFEHGTQRAALTAQNIGTSWQTFTWTWQASILQDQSGAGVEMRLDVLDGTSGQGYFSVDAVDWIARFESRGGGGGGGGAWPAGWGPRPALGSHHGIGAPFNFYYNPQGILTWQPLRDYNEWLGRPANICKVWSNWDRPGASTWDDVAGGAGSADTTWAGQLNQLNPNRAFDPAHWPITAPIVFGLTGVPWGFSNRRENNTWGRPGIWEEIARGDYDIYYQRLFRRIATRCGQTGRDPRTVILRWNWEANGYWYSHSIGPDKSNFIIAWRRCMDIMRNAVGAVLGAGKSFMIEFGPTGHLAYFGTGQNERLWNIYPGDDWVDIVGVGIHDYVGIKTQADWDQYLRSPTRINGIPYEGLIDWFDFGISRGKWVGTSEIESNYIPRTYFPKTENMDVMWRTGFEVLRRRYDGRFVYFIYLWQSKSALKRDDGWGEPYRQLYKP